MIVEPISVNRIAAAIASEELTLEFQPVVTRKPRQLLKLEALVRWDHPAKGRIKLTDFLPIAETDVPTIGALTAWVVSAAIDAYQALAEAGLRVPIE
jgi:EAL domain-containing protein (putative c-di-GMP-specific phosphodiesterase class I)